MGYTFASGHIAIESNYVWEMFTRDRHLVASSDGFASAQACIDDGLKQGLPILGRYKQLR